MGTNGWLFSTKEAPRVIIQPGNWPCLPLRLLSLSFKGHHSHYPQLLYSQLATVGPILKTALLALSIWLTKAIFQGFLGNTISSSTGCIQEALSSKYWTPFHGNAAKQKFHGFFNSPRARIHLGIRKFSLLPERIQPLPKVRHGAIFKVLAACIFSKVKR